jgi:outer membrane protein TolC
MKNVIITNLIAEIANNYYELVAIDQSISVIEKNINIQENALQMAKVLKETGASNELAIKQFTVQLLNIKAVKTELRQKTTEIENKINFLIGRYPQTIDRDHKFNTANLSTAIKFGVPSSLLQNRPDIKMAEFNLTASKANLKSARAQFYPNLTITGAFGYQAFRTNLLFNPQSVAFNLLGGFTAPLLNRSAIKASFDKANAYQIETLYAYQSTILNACLEVNTEMERINNLKDLLQLKTEETKELNHSINIAADLFKFGKANYLEVLTVQQNALQAELDLIETEKKQFQTTVNIYKALGGGWN